MTLRPNLAILTVGMLLALIEGFAQTTPPKQRSVWDGVFNQAEADRGFTAYTLHCSRCHGQNLEKYGAVLVGSKFMDHWREDNVGNLFTRIRETMPPGPRGRVTDAEYRDIVAYVLSVNEFPAGAGGLAPAEIDKILIVGKEGPRSVPDFSLVTVVGCLARDGEKSWMVTNASEPVRTRLPRESSEAELAAAVARRAGNHTFHFLDTFEFAAEFRAGRWVEAKGFLIRSPGNDRINPTWIKGLRETCESGVAPRN